LRCENPAKHPFATLAPNGLKHATTDLARVAEWWSIAPDCNVGVATGSAVVLDIDPRHGGEASLAALEREHGPFPATWQALTGGGGEHIYFSAPDGQEIRNSAGRLGPGLDVRGVGGYVVAPPSVHISGRPYAWSVDHHPDEVALAPLPAWLAARLTAPALGGAISTDWQAVLGVGGVGEGRRNDTLARLVGHLLRRYVDPHLVLELAHAWNEARCCPPLPADEVAITVNSICRRELQRRREAA
jgi:hypothetical protein